MRLKTLYCWLILFFYLYTKYFIYNFVITRSSEICSLSICCFSIIICFFTKPLTLEILFSASLIFVLKTVAITNPLTYGIFLLTSSIFFSKFWLLVLYWFMQTKVISTGIFFSKLPTWVFRLLYFGFFQHSYLLHHFIFANQKEQISTQQHLINSLFSFKWFLWNYST